MINISCDKCKAKNALGEVPVQRYSLTVRKERYNYSKNPIYPIHDPFIIYGTGASINQDIEFSEYIDLCSKCYTEWLNKVKDLLA